MQVTRGALLGLLVVACGGGSDSPSTYTFEGETYEIVCDDFDLFMEQFLDAAADQEVFDAWQAECGDAWADRAVERILFGDDG